MKKLILINLAILLSLVGFSQGSFPVPVGKGMTEEATHRARVIAASGTYYPNIAPHEIDERTSYGLQPIFEMIPSGSKAAVLYSQLPTDATGDFTVANATAAPSKTTINQDGYIDGVAANVPRFDYTSGIPVLLTEPASENLITYPVTVGNTDYWTLSGSTISADPTTAGSELITAQVDRDFSGANNWANFDLNSFDATGDLSLGSTASGTLCFLDVLNMGTITDGNMYLLKVDVANIVGTWRIQWGGSGQVIATITADGTQKEYYFYQETGSNGDLVVISATEGATSVDLDNFTLKEVTGFSSPHADSPYDVSAYKLVEDGATSTHYIERSLTVTSAATVTQSVRVKAGERNWVRFEETASADGYYFDLTNGVIGTAIGTVDDYSISALVDGYYTISITVTVPSTTAVFRLGLADADASNSYAGDGSSGAFIAFPQAEEQSYPTSLMLPSSEGSTSTRVADAVTGAGDATLFSSVNSSGVLYAEIASATATDAANSFIMLSDGTVSNTVAIIYTLNTIRGQVKVGAATQFDYTESAAGVTDYHKVAVRWTVNDFSLWIDGVEINTDASGSIFPASTLNVLDFAYASGGNDFRGNTRQVAVYNYLTDEEIQNLTTP